MTQKQIVAHLLRENRSLTRERARLRKCLSLAADCVQASAHGHTPDWRKLSAKVERYEDSYSPLE